MTPTKALRIEELLRKYAPLIALTFVNASIAIPYSEHNVRIGYLDPFEWAVQVLIWVAIIALVVCGLKFHDLFDEMVFLDSWIFALVALLVLADSPHLDWEFRWTIALVYIGIATGIGAYWLDLRRRKRWTPNS